MDERQEAAARKIVNLVPWWDRDGQTEEEALKDVYNTISLDPVSIIEFLLDRIEEDEA